MPTHFVSRNSTDPSNHAGLPHAAPIRVDSDDNILKIIPAGSGTTEVQVVDASSTQTLTNKTLTTPTFTSLVSSITTTTGASAAAAAAASGTTYFLNRATGLDFTLPTVAAGLYYKFVVGTNLTTNATIAGAASTLRGNVCAADGGAGTSIAAGTTLTINQTTDIVGDTVEFLSDGTNWFFKGQCAVAVGMSVA